MKMCRPGWNNFFVALVIWDITPRSLPDPNGIISQYIRDRWSAKVPRAERF